MERRIKLFEDFATETAKSNAKKVDLAEFKARFAEDHSHISHSLSDKKIQKWLDELGEVSLDKAVDLFQDHLLSQGLADDVQE